MEAVRDHYGIPKKTSETRTLARLLQALLNEALYLDREMVARLAQLLPPPMSDVLTRVLVFPKQPGAVPEAVPTVETEKATPVVSLSVEDAFSPDGPIAASFGSFESRSGQLAMAQAIDAAFRDGHAALVEAGPGTGKTYAYLIPAILHLQRNPSDRVLVSTRTWM